MHPLRGRAGSQCCGHVAVKKGSEVGGGGAPLCCSSRVAPALKAKAPTLTLTFPPSPSGVPQFALASGPSSAGGHTGAPQARQICSRFLICFN